MTCRKILLSVLILSGSFNIAFSQDKWDLQRAVDYALANNISVKQADVQARIAELMLKQSRQSQIPLLNFSGSIGYNSGRNQDPTTFGLITTSYLSSGYSLQTNVELFNWFTKRNTIAANDFEAQASRAAVDKLKNDIALNVAAAYLQALLSKEQANIVTVQVQQTEAQLLNTRKLVNAGSIPEINAANLEAQLARDSSSLVTAQGTAIQALLQLKALLNLDASLPFDIQTPPVELIPVENISELQPEAVYAEALINLPQQKVNALRLKSAERSVEVARGSMYPSFSAYGSLGTAFNNQAQEIKGFTQVSPPIGKVDVNGTEYNVLPLTPFTNYTFGKSPYFGQLNQNFSQSVGLSISVPILNGGSLRANYGRAKLNLQSVELQKQQDNLTLKQDIYQSYNNAISSLQSFNAAKTTVRTTQKVYDFAIKRYELGLLSTFDLITSQNNLTRAKLDLANAQMDYVFKMKVLEFYKGRGIRLQ